MTSKRPFIIGVAGGSASGKTTLCNKILKSLTLQFKTLNTTTSSIVIDESSVLYLSLDSFYRVLNKEEHDLAKASKFDFDCPEAFDWACLKQCLFKILDYHKQIQFNFASKDTKDVKDSKIALPKYDFKTCDRIANESIVIDISKVQVIILEGILTLHDQELRSLYDLKIFTETDSDLRLARRIQRDVQERGRSFDSVIQQYMSTVKPGHDKYIAPSRKFADMFVVVHLAIDDLPHLKHL